jgi:hypothetical protein
MPPAGTRPTGSNGTQAPDQPGTLDGVLAPSSVNASGTDTPAGKIQAPPAAKDGSMGPLAIDLQKLTATAIAAGTPADQMYAQNKAVIGRALETGKISQPVADALLANYGGDASSRNAQISAASALATTNATQAGETARKMAELVDMPDPNDPTKTIKVPLGQVQGQGGRVTMAPSAQTAANTNVQVKLPNGTVVWQRAGAPVPPGATNYDSALEQTKQQQGGTKGSYFDTKTATVHFVDAQTAQDNGWITLPDSKEKLDALLGTELSNAKTPEQAQEIRDRYMRFASLPKPVDQAAQFQQQQIDYATDQRLNPMPAPGVTPTGLTNPVAYAPDAQRAIEERAQQLMSRDPFMQNNPGRAHERAIQELRDEHSIPTVDQVNEMRGHWGPKVQGALFGNPKLSLYQPPGGKAQEHLMVGLIPKQPGAPGAGGGTPTSQATPAQTAVTPPAQTAVTPPAQTAVTPPAQTAVTPPAPSSLSTIVTPPLPQETRQAPVARGSASPRAMVRPSYLPPPQQGPPAPPSPLALTRSPRAFPRTTVPPAPAAPAAPAVAQPAVPGGGRFGQTGQLPAGAVSVAPAGLPDGSTMPNPAGGNFVVHGGFVFPG